MLILRHYAICIRSNSTIHKLIIVRIHLNKIEPKMDIQFSNITSRRNHLHNISRYSHSQFLSKNLLVFH